MDSENKFWITVWSIVAAVVITGIVAIAVDSVNDTNAINKMVQEQKVEPLRASCAVKGMTHNDVCSILATK